MSRTTLGTALILIVLPAVAFAQSATAPDSSAEHTEARAKVRTACAADVQKFCADIDRAKGAMRTCLDQNPGQPLPGVSTPPRAERAPPRDKDKS